MSNCGLLQQFLAVLMEESQPVHPVPATGGEDAEVTWGAKVAEASRRRAGASIRVLVEVVGSFCHGLLPLSWTAEMALERSYEPLTDFKVWRHQCFRISVFASRAGICALGNRPFTLVGSVPVCMEARQGTVAANLETVCENSPGG